MVVEADDSSHGILGQGKTLLDSACLSIRAWAIREIAQCHQGRQVALEKTHCPWPNSESLPNWRPKQTFQWCVKRTSFLKNGNVAGCSSGLAGPQTGKLRAFEAESAHQPPRAAACRGKRRRWHRAPASCRWANRHGLGRISRARPTDQLRAKRSAGIGGSEHEGKRGEESPSTAQRSASMRRPVIACRNGCGSPRGQVGTTRRRGGVEPLAHISTTPPAVSLRHGGRPPGRLPLRNPGNGPEHPIPLLFRSRPGESSWAWSISRAITRPPAPRCSPERKLGQLATGQHQKPARRCCGGSPSWIARRRFRARQLSLPFPAEQTPSARSPRAAMVDPAVLEAELQGRTSPAAISFAAGSTAQIRRDPLDPLTVFPLKNATGSAEARVVGPKTACRSAPRRNTQAWA